MRVGKVGGRDMSRKGKKKEWRVAGQWKLYLSRHRISNKQRSTGTPEHSNQNSKMATRNVIV